MNTHLDRIIRSASGTPRSVTRSVLTRARSLGVPRRAALARLAALRPDALAPSVKLRRYTPATPTDVAVNLFGWMLQDTPVTPRERRAMSVTMCSFAATTLRAAGGAGGAVFSDAVGDTSHDSGQLSQFVDTALITRKKLGVMLGVSRQTAGRWLDLCVRHRLLSMPQEKPGGGVVVRVRRPRKHTRAFVRDALAETVTDLASGKPRTALGWLLLNPDHAAFSYGGEAHLWHGLVALTSRIPHENLGLTKRQFGRIRKRVSAHHIDVTDAEKLRASLDAYADATGASDRAEAAHTAYEHAAQNRREELRKVRARRVALTPVIREILSIAVPPEGAEGECAKWLTRAYTIIEKLPPQVRPHAVKRLAQVLAKAGHVKLSEAVSSLVVNDEGEKK